MNNQIKFSGLVRSVKSLPGIDSEAKEFNSETKSSRHIPLQQQSVLFDGLFVVCDVDGVLTDGRYYYTSMGKHMKAFSVLDHDGVDIFKSVGIPVHFVSSDGGIGFEISVKRVSELGTLHSDRGQSRSTFIRQTFGPLNRCIFIGDSLYDSEVMPQVLVACAPFESVASSVYSKTRPRNLFIECPVKGGDGVLFWAAKILITDQALFDHFSLEAN